MRQDFNIDDPQPGNSPAGNVDFMADYFVDCLPPYYRPEDSRDFLRRFFYFAAEDLANQNATIDQIYELINPATASVEWLDWMLAEWWGWTLIPEGYPVARKRRLLSNLHLHYEHRYTLRGVRELLREFGIIAEVYDRRVYVGGFYGSYGSPMPLRVRVRILNYEAFFHPQRTTVGWYYGGTHAHTTKQIITDNFVLKLIRWCRPVGTQFLVEWRTGSAKLINQAVIMDDDDFDLA